MSFVFLKNLLAGSSPHKAKQEHFSVLPYTLYANGTLHHSESEPASPTTDQVLLRSRPRTSSKTDSIPSPGSEGGLADVSSISTAVDDRAEHDEYLFDKAELEFDASESSRTSRLDPRIISDATIGLSDGLTVPFALSAGLSALGSTKVVIYGGIAELVAGSISMGLGGYLGARSEV